MAFLDLVAPIGDYYLGIVLRELEIVPSGGPLAGLFRSFSFDGYALDLGKIHVMEVQREFEVPTIHHPHQANFAGLAAGFG